MSDMLRSHHVGLRVSRARSCAVNNSGQGSSGSLTHGAIVNATERSLVDDGVVDLVCNVAVHCVIRLVVMPRTICDGHSVVRDRTTAQQPESSQNPALPSAAGRSTIHAFESSRAIHWILDGARLLLLGILVLLAPAVRIICSAATLLGALTCGVFAVSAAGPKFPLLETPMLSAAFGVFAVAYHALLAFLSR